MDFNQFRTAFFTGPRPSKLVGYNYKAYQTLNDFLVDYVRYLVEDRGISEYISGGAQGFDQVAFWAVNRVKSRTPFNVKNVVNAPFPGQADIWHPEGAFGQKDYEKMLKVADEVRMTKQQKPGNPRDIRKALMDRNQQMMERSSVCIALWPEGDDTWESASGGTADAMRKAEAAGRQLHIVRYQILPGEYPNQFILPTQVDII